MTGPHWSGLNRLLATVIVAATPSVADAGWFGPSNYDECILDKMKGVTSDAAAREIKSACRSKFSSANTDSEPPASSVKLTYWESSEKALTQYTSNVLGKIKLLGRHFDTSEGPVFRVFNGSRVHISRIYIGYYSKSKYGNVCPIEKEKYNEIEDYGFAIDPIPDNEGAVYIDAGYPRQSKFKVTLGGAIDERKLKSNSLCLVGIETALYRNRSDLEARLKAN